jgi:glucuronoarabinoxylan endo-1,4-beta-xylanase
VFALLHKHRTLLGKTMMRLAGTFFAALLMLSLYATPSRAQSATVYWNKVDQVIDGFGASDANETGPLTSAQASLLFSPTSGIGLSLLRTAVPTDGSCATINTTCAGEVSDMQFAIANGAKVWSTSWSPPAAMKSNGSLDYGGSMLAGSYGADATYLANYVKSLSTLYGIHLDALSIQNEPDVINVSYSSAYWSGANFASFIGTNLGPTFAADGITTFIVLPETSNWQQLANYANTTMNDAAAADYVSIVATHDYDHNGAPPYPLGQGKGKHFWETEVCDENALDPSMTSALKYAQYLNAWMTIANANAWHYWRLISINSINHHPNGDNEGLIALDGTITKRFYMMGNYSKFVRPGFYRIDATATPQTGVSVSAYKNNSTGALVVVVINQNSASVSQSFTLNGTTVSSVTPWVTSPALDLVQQPNVSVGGGTFTYTLPGSSVTSFVATTTGAPPASLTTKVH